jgi:hypothetical protein
MAEAQGSDDAENDGGTKDSIEAQDRRWSTHRDRLERVLFLTPLQLLRFQ